MSLPITSGQWKGAVAAGKQVVPERPHFAILCDRLSLWLPARVRVGGTLYRNLANDIEHILRVERQDGHVEVGLHQFLHVLVEHLGVPLS